jgi:hypothetical protein
MYSVQQRDFLMMIRSLKVVLLGGLILAATSSAQAGVLASSTFDTDTQGWTVRDFGTHYFIPAKSDGFYTTTPGSPSVVFDGAAGNAPSGAGALRFNETGGGSWEFFSAPAAFAGNKNWVNTPVSGGTENILGGTLKFDIKIDSLNSYVGTPYIGVIFYTDNGTPGTGDDISLLYELALPAISGGTTGWTTVTVNIPTAGVPGGGSPWRKNFDNGGGSAISAADFTSVFSDLDALYISADWASGSEIVFLDNVSLNGVFTADPPPPFVIPEPSSVILLLTAGFPALIALRRRKNPLVV